MDFTVILQPLWEKLWFLVPLFLLVAVLNSARFKGWVGEAIVNLSAHFLLDRKTYHLIRNVTLPTEDRTTQIDHLIVSPYGVFVVETKNMKGWIYGGERQRYWTQKVYRHSQKFQNPLHQNYKHLKTVQSRLGLTDDQVCSLVVFVGDSTFKTSMPDNVTQGLGFIRFIKSHTSVVLTTVQVKTLVEDIARGRLKPTWRTHRDHVRHVQGIVERKQGEAGLAAGREDYPFGQRRQQRDGWLVKPLFVVGVLAFATIYWTSMDKPDNGERSPSVQIAQAKAREQRLALEREQRARQEALRVEREAAERVRLARLEREREYAFEKAFDESYVALEGCDNWRSDRHMVECVNHRMRAKSGFRESNEK
ncbi:nuclease-related domain-containing protein [Marinobacter sp. AN1]|uniref:nuclease-related domain-containing protein n=1 Tax=Marinobacter sp. AN1 TaxID=2886046 RepID=UPI00222F0C77|nr:NERD domain-containing protein [Marinobacter sp. AN1]UZD66724.1 NERD domain-containing protein [Marinobacter sp. AN1]